MFETIHMFIIKAKRNKLTSRNIFLQTDKLVNVLLILVISKKLKYYLKLTQNIKKLVFFFLTEYLFQKFYIGVLATLKYFPSESFPWTVIEVQKITYVVIM